MFFIKYTKVRKYEEKRENEHKLFVICKFSANLGFSKIRYFEYTQFVGSLNRTNIQKQYIKDHQCEHWGDWDEMSYPSRKARTRKELFRKKKTHLIIIANFWMLYFILIGFIPLTNSTFSFFSDTETISNSFSAADNFCADDEYAKAHKEECKRKDNSGIGNGPETGDDGERKTDPDNPKHGDDDDHPKPPIESESTINEDPVKTENLDTENQNANIENGIQESKKDDNEMAKSPNSLESP
jgi:hypothetical protein